MSADAQGRQALRRNYLAAERYADEYLLRLGPRSVKQVLEPSDLRGTKQFLARLRAYLEAWADVVEF